MEKKEAGTRRNGGAERDFAIWGILTAKLSAMIEGHFRKREECPYAQKDHPEEFSL